MVTPETPSAKSESSSTPSPRPHGIVRLLEEAETVLGGGGGGGGGGGPPLTDFSPFFIDGGGPVLTQVRVVPIFWGTAWAGNPNPTMQQVTAAIAQIVSGPYMDGLSQYRDIARGQLVTAPGSQATTADPPNPFAMTDVENLVANLIQSGALPSPQDSAEYLYMVFMPLGTKGPVGIGGEHWWMPVGRSRAHLGWVLGGPLDTMAHP